MGFFTDLKQDLSQAVNELTPEENGQNTEAVDEVAEPTASEELFNTEDNSLMGDLEAMLEKGVDELDAPQEAAESAFASETAEQPAQDFAPVEEPVEVQEEKKEIEEMATEEVNELLDEVDSMMSQPGKEIPVTNTWREEAPKPSFSSFSQADISSETAVITAGMTITGDIASNGSMDVIGCINGNIDIQGKLNVTGTVNGNSTAAEIFAESAQINGEMISKGSVKIGQSSVIIGNISANSAVIAGAVKGDIDVHGPVILDTSAIVMGNIKSKSVQINNGAVIEGMCSQCYADVSPTSFFTEIKKSRK